MNGPELFGADVGLDDVVTDPPWLLGRWLARAGGSSGSGSAPGSDREADSASGSAGTDHVTTPLMALATVDAGGGPCVRHVLLSSHDADGLHFHTDAATEKAAELREHPRAAATIVWPDLPRQLTVSGPVRAESPAEAAAGYARRSRYLQLLAWVNTSELADRPVADRRAQWEAYDRDHPGPLRPPDSWCGFVLIPERISFWRGGPEGPSQRVVCHRAGPGSGGGWSIQRRPG